MTEDDAKGKWCPFARENIETKLTSDATDTPTGNRFENNGFIVQSCCIGSDCMMWRSTKMQFRDNATKALSDKDLTGNGRWVSVEGYCGLAGKPHP